MLDSKARRIQHVVYILTTFTVIHSNQRRAESVNVKLSFEAPVEITCVFKGSARRGLPVPCRNHGQLSSKPLIELSVILHAIHDICCF
jgi:hypothetical protein